MEAAQPALIGQTLNSYKVIELLGAGGMGVVYKALDTRLERTVALKFLPQASDVSDRFRTQLMEEARAASKLDHPNIGTIHGIEETASGQMFIVMAYYEGETLARKIRGPLPYREAAGIALQIAHGLEAAHAHNVVHRDIKPSNVIMTAQGVAKIVDFGLARVITSAASTRSLSTSGTAAYMSPEQALEKKAIDQRTDLWSLGVVLYEMLTARLPFSGESVPGMLFAIANSAPRQMDVEVPAELQQIVYRALAKDPAARYQSATEMIADLERAVPAATGARPAASAAATATLSRYRELASQSALTLPGQKPQRSAAAKWFFAALGVVVLLGLSLLIPAVRQRIASPQKGGILGPSLPATRILAVLPLQVQGSDPKLTDLANGLLETLTAKLARLGADHSLQVISTSELRARHISKLEEVRQEMGATLGFQAALQQSGDLVRVSYSLLDTKTGRVLRSNTMDAPLSDPFSIEDEVTSGAASALGVDLRPEEKRELASHGTGSPEAYNYYLQGRGYAEKGPESADSAIALYQHALALDPTYGLAEANLGTAYWAKYESSKDKKFVAKARDACSKSIDLGNAGASGHVCLGVLENGTGEYEKAAEEFTRAIQLDPSLDQAYTGLATAYERLGKLNDAQNTYQQAIKLRPQYWKGYNQLGIFYCKQSQYDQCTAMFQKVAELTPESFRGYANLGAVYLAEGKYDQAIAPLKQSLQIRATGPTYSNLGTAYFHLRRFAEAAAAYTQATRLNDQDYLIWGNLGDAQYFAGNRQDAAKSYRKAIDLAKESLKVNPRSPAVLKDIADYCIMMGERDAAMQSLNQALTYGKGDKEILFGAALIYNHAGETGPALEWLNKALKAGYSVETVRESPDLDNLRGNPRYQALVQGKQD